MYHKCPLNNEVHRIFVFNKFEYFIKNMFLYLEVELEVPINIAFHLLLELDYFNDHNCYVNKI